MARRTSRPAGLGGRAELEIRSFPSSPDGHLDPVGGVLDGFVFPDPQDQPSVPFKLDVRATIAVDVCGELAFPERAIALRENAVVRARMPEAAVDEDRDTLGGEEDV